LDVLCITSSHTSHHHTHVTHTLGCSVQHQNTHVLCIITHMFSASPHPFSVHHIIRHMSHHHPHAWMFCASRISEKKRPRTKTWMQRGHETYMQRGPDTTWTDRTSTYMRHTGTHGMPFTGTHGIHTASLAHTGTRGMPCTHSIPLCMK